MSLIRKIGALVLVAIVMLPASVHARGASSSASFSPEIRQRLLATVDREMQLMHLPGLLANVTLPGHGSWSIARGLASRETDTPMQLADRVRIASISKSMTLTLILMLMDRGRLALDDPISKYVSGVPNGENITIRMLGDMRSGLFNYPEDETYQKESVTYPYRGWAPRQLLALSFKHPPYFPPNDGYRYSNANTVLLGLVIEKLTGLPLAKVFSQWLFRPLGMTHSFFATNGHLPAPYASGYTNRTLSGKIENTTHWSPTVAWAAGAVVSTLHDMVIWTEALERGSLLSARAQQERLAFVPVGNPPGEEYGLGVIRKNGWIYHDGSIAGFTSWTGYYPPNQAIISVYVTTNIPFQVKTNSGPEPRSPPNLIAHALGRVAVPGENPPTT